jgi:hypothetical protein
MASRALKKARPEMPRGRLLRIGEYGHSTLPAKKKPASAALAGFGYLFGLAKV